MRAHAAVEGGGARTATRLLVYNMYTSTCIASAYHYIYTAMYACACCCRRRRCLMLELLLVD